MTMRIEDFCDVKDGGLVLRCRLWDYLRHDILTADDVINRQLDMLERLGSSNLPLIIKGESGSGKDRIAQYAHDVSNRKNKPLHKINCAYYPDVQTANRLLGSEGLLYQAADSSLYIENMDMLSDQSQHQLWEFISSAEGKRRNIRLMACLRENGGSRDYALIEPLSDYFGSVEFVLPPLRRRKADILLLTMQQLQSIREQHRVVRTVSPEVMETILAYEWPGNIRQLIKVINQMAFMSDDTLMDSVSLLQSMLSVNKRHLPPQPVQQEPATAKTLKELVADYEVGIINQYVERYGSQRKAAAALGISHSALSIKLTKYYAASSGKK